MIRKIHNVVVSSGQHALRRKIPYFHYPQVAPRRSFATGTLPRRTINLNQVVDDIKAYPSTLLQTADLNKLKHVEKEEEQQRFGHAYIGMTGGQIFHEMMLEHGVKYIFGYPGGAILPVFDALHESSAIDFFLVKHEQGAGHMAEGYARASGRPGIVVVTSGPGATNLITPLQDALMDGTPIIAFCGQVATFDLGKDSFQEADVMGLARACTKWSVQVQTVHDLPRCINEAFTAATTGRPGPVLVDLPRDVTAAILGSSMPLTPPTHSTFMPTEELVMNSKDLAATITRAADLLNQAKKPVIYAGQGILSHPDGPVLLNKLSQIAKVPVTTTLLGLGAYDEHDPKSLHMLGMHGSCYANLAMQEADVIVAMGARFDDRITRKLAGFAPAAHKAASEGRGGIIHFEIWPHNMDKVVKAMELIPGDVVKNLAEFVKLVKAVPIRQEWLAQIAEWKERYPWAYEKEDDSGIIKPQTVISVLDELTAKIKDNTIIATGVGAHQMFAAQHYRWRSPRSMITSGGLGTMGFGLPAAIGAKIARPKALVVDVDGDSSFGMTMTELTTAKCYNISVKVLILNNNEQGMVTHSQQMFFNDRYSHTHGSNVDFVKFGDATGVQADRVENISELRDKLHWLLFETGDSSPALLEVVVDSKVPILPIVMPGTALHEFVAFDEERERARRLLTRERSGR